MSYRTILGLTYRRSFLEAWKRTERPNLVTLFRTSSTETVSTVPTERAKEEEEDNLVASLIQGIKKKGNQKHSLAGKGRGNSFRTSNKIDKDLLDAILSSSVDSKERKSTPSLGLAETLSSEVAKKTIDNVTLDKMSNPTVESLGTMNSFRAATVTSNFMRGTTPITDSRKEHQELEKMVRIKRNLYNDPNKGDAPVVEWMCIKCQTYNYDDRNSCRYCDAAKEVSKITALPPSRQVSTFPSKWVCESCGQHNDSTNIKTTDLMASRKKFFCEGCSTMFRGVRPWFCPSCAHLNPKASSQCATCYADRVANWMCKNCNDSNNSVYQTACRTCGQERDQKYSNSITNCLACSAVNDVRWEICESCLAPLPTMVDVMKCMSGPGGELHPILDPGVRSPSPSPCSDVIDEVQEDSKINSSEIEGRQNLSIPDENVAVEPSVDIKKNESKLLTDPTQRNGNTTPKSGSYIHARPKVEPLSPLGSPPPGSELAGAWWCANCNIVHRRNVTFCDICLEPKSLAIIGRHTGETMDIQDTQKGTNAEGQDDTTSEKLQRISPGDWLCPYCRQYNDVHTQECCGRLREVSPDHWLCLKCSSTNHNIRKKCIGCGSLKPPEEWKCFICSHKNSPTLDVCVHCEINRNAHYWTCDKCKAETFCTHDRCKSCGEARTDTDFNLPGSEIFLCPSCDAPNGKSRHSCFRCRSHFSGVEWTCPRCHYEKNKKSRNLACVKCHTPREFNFDEITWVCDVCSCNIKTGGDLPEVKNCHLCFSSRREDSFFFPSRWRCGRCGLGNLARNPCCECGTKRHLKGLQIMITCPHCCKSTVLNEEEVCACCNESLTTYVTSMTNEISNEISPEVLLNPYVTLIDPASA